MSTIKTHPSVSNEGIMIVVSPYSMLFRHLDSILYLNMNRKNPKCYR